MTRVSVIVGAVLLGWVVVVWAQQTPILRGSFNAETSGNTLTMPVVVDMQVANCSAAAGWSNWDQNTSGTDSPTFACVAGLSNGPVGVYDFDDMAAEYLWNRFKLPDDWTGTMSLALYWSTSATTGNVVWQLETACVADGESIDAGWNTAQTITDAAKGTTTRINVATLASVTTTGCAAGEIFKFRLFRNPAHASDTIAATARLYHFELTYRRAI